MIDENYGEEMTVEEYVLSRDYNPKQIEQRKSVAPYGS
jgi:hypothetical protein